MSERRLLFAGAALTPFGIAVALLTNGKPFAVALAAAGVALLLLGLHRFGRSGPDSFERPDGADPGR